MKLPSTIENFVRFFFPHFNIKNEGGLCIARDCYFDNSSQVEFGKDVFVNRKCQFHVGSKNARIVIGNSVWIGMDVCFVCPTHEIGNFKQRAGRPLYNDIIIEDGCWIGARTTILPGVTIGEGSVVAAGSVVDKSLAPNCLWGGVPAKLLKHLK